MISLCHMLIQKKIIIISGVTEILSSFFKNDYPELFNFEPGVLHF